MAVILARTLILYASILISLRLLGKRQLGEMELSEFVISALIADVASIPLQDVGIPIANGLVPVAALFCCEILISGLSLKNARFRTFLFGKPSILIDHGVIDEKELRKNRFTLDELMEELRCASVTDLSQIAYAILETNGDVHLILIPSAQTPTCEQLGISTEDPGLPFVLIADGRILDENLLRSGHDRTWLQSQLRSLGYPNAKALFLMTVDACGKIYAQKKETT